MPINRIEIERLAALAKNGDAEAFLSLVEAWKGSMYRTARTILGSDADCADALQETILKAYGAVGKLKNPAFFKTWLYRILINECNTIRRKQARISLPGVMPEPAQEEGDYRMVELKEALSRLKEPLRLAVALVDMEDMKIVEAARVLGVSEGALKMRLKRGRAQLCEWLEPNGKGESGYERTEY